MCRLGLALWSLHTNTPIETFLVLVLDMQAWRRRSRPWPSSRIASWLRNGSGPFWTMCTGLHPQPLMEMEKWWWQNTSRCSTMCGIYTRGTVMCTPNVCTAMIIPPESGWKRVCDMICLEVTSKLNLCLEQKKPAPTAQNRVKRQLNFEVIPNS